MDLISLLSEILGDGTAYSKGEIYFSCPFCHHHSKKLAINVVKKAWHCWICDSRGKTLLSLFKRLDATPEQLRRLRGIVTEADIAEYKADKTHSVLRLPAEYHPLWVPKNTFEYNNALKYLKSRDISGLDIIRYKMGFCESGTYAGRIIIPSYDSVGNLNYFTGRSIYPTRLKYKNPPISKNVIIFENQVNWNLSPVVLCEGVFDAIAIRRNAIPLMGKTIPPVLLQALVQSKIEHVHIALDADATLQAMKNEQVLSQYNIAATRVVFSGKDPAELGFELAWDNIISNSTTTTFKEFVNQRLLEEV